MANPEGMFPWQNPQRSRCAGGRRPRRHPRLHLLSRPLVLITLGFSGARIGNLTALEPYRPIFIGAALVALFFAAPHLPSGPRLRAGRGVRRPRVRTTYKVLFWIVAALVVIALVFPYLAPLFY